MQYSCQGGRWKKYAGTAPAPDPTPSYKNCSGGHKHGSSWSTVQSVGCGNGKVTTHYLCNDGTSVITGSNLQGSRQCSCFPAGMPVLMADGSWKEISIIEAGDVLMGPDGPWVVDSLYITKLGNRRMYRDQDSTILWSEEHLFWAKQDGQQWWWSAGKDAWLEEVSAGETIGLFDNNSIMNHVMPSIAHSHDIWRDVNMIDVTDQYDYDTPLYMPKSENGESAFISGYLVTCGTDQWKKDYTQQLWSEKQAKLVFNKINLEDIPGIDNNMLNKGWSIKCAEAIRLKARELLTENNNLLIAA